MATTKEELQERAQLVRVHEANCKIEYPTKDEANFRLAIMKKIGGAFSLRELRDKVIEGPVTATVPAPTPKQQPQTARR
jgi:hypothetical protein